VEHGENERSPLLLVIMRVKEMLKSYLPHLLKKTPCTLPNGMNRFQIQGCQSDFLKKACIFTKKTDLNKKSWVETKLDQSF